MAASSFLVRSGHSAHYLNLPLGDFAQYILLFCAGITSSLRGWLPNLSYENGIRWLSVVLPTGLAAWLALMIFAGPMQNRGPDLSGGWHWQSAAFCVWESATCVAVSFGLIVVFREKFNSQGRVAEFLSKNAFSVYVFHPPIVILMARLMHGVQLHPLVKFGMLAITSTIVVFGLSAVLLRRIPLLRQIL
jgi:hypothetical protein